MHRGFARLVFVVQSVLVTDGRAQNAVGLPTAEDVANIVTLCGAGIGIRIDANLRGSIIGIFKQSGATQGSARQDVVAKIISQILPQQRLQAYQSYLGCVENRFPAADAAAASGQPVETDWYRIDTCGFEKLIGTTSVEFGISRFPPESQEDQSLSVSLILTLPSKEFAQPSGYDSCQSGDDYEDILGAADFGNYSYQVTTQTRRVKEEVGSKLCGETSQNVPILFAFGRGYIEAALDTLASGGPARLRIRNGPKLGTVINVSLSGLKEGLLQAQCPIDVNRFLR